MRFEWQRMTVVMRVRNRDDEDVPADGISSIVLYVFKNNIEKYTFHTMLLDIDTVSERELIASLRDFLADAVRENHW